MLTPTRVVLTFFVMAVIDYACYAQFKGGKGSSQSSVVTSSININDYPHCLGGSGRGDVRAANLNVALFNTWDGIQNNRVITRSALANAVALGTIVSIDVPTSTSRCINQQSFSAFGLQSFQSGVFQTGVSKPPTQLLIRGNFRGITICTTLGQTACTQQSNYTQTIWLDQDRMLPNQTKCFIDKTLISVYSSGNGSDWYNILGGGAVKIAPNGIITQVTCY